MKVCERCGTEIATRDGDNLCAACEEAEANGKRRRGTRARRKEMDDVMSSLGLVKVRGALGGVYYE